MIDGNWHYLNLGYQTRYNLEEGFPLLTTKKVFFKGILYELLWFITGSTNIQPLVEHNVKIWNDWPYDKFKKSNEFKGETMEQFIERIKTDDEFAAVWGELGPVYGKQWRDFFGVDQLTNLIEQIKNNPFPEGICLLLLIQLKLMIWLYLHVMLFFSFMSVQMAKNYHYNFIREVQMSF